MSNDNDEDLVGIDEVNDHVRKLEKHVAADFLSRFVRYTRRRARHATNLSKGAFDGLDESRRDFGSLCVPRARPDSRRALPDGSDSASLAAGGLEPRTHPFQGFVAFDQFRLAFPNLRHATVNFGGPSLLPFVLCE